MCVYCIHIYIYIIYTVYMTHDSMVPYKYKLIELLHFSGLRTLPGLPTQRHGSEPARGPTPDRFRNCR